MAEHSESERRAMSSGSLPEYWEYKERSKRHREHLAHRGALSFQPDARTAIPEGPPTRSLREGLTQSFASATARGIRPSNPALFEEFYPSQKKFMWHHTAAYWTAVLFVQGSLLFTFASGIELFKGTLDWQKESTEVLTLWPNFVGAIMFEIGAYCSYLNLINLKKEAHEKIDYVCADWDKVRRNDSEVTSRVGTMAYFYGASIFGIGVVTPFMGLPSRSLASYLFVTMPGVIGSVCFVIGGVCEILHNRVFGSCGRGHGEQDEQDAEVMGHGSTWRDASWWISILNTIGGANFLFGYMPAFFRLEGEGAELFTAANFFVGSLIFVMTSWLLVVMWKHNDFGLALIRQLNDAVDSDRRARRRRQQPSSQAVPNGVPHTAIAPGHLGVAEASVERSMSIRGASFIGVYCWLSAMAIVNIMCMNLWDEHSREKHRHKLRLWSQTWTQLILIAGVMLVIGYHSTVVSVPKRQPYRSLVFFSRVVLTFGAIIQTVSFLDFLTVPYDSPKPLP